MIKPDEDQWLTYREAGQVLGIKPEAVRSRARREGWSRQTPNEIGGVARVFLPTGLARRARPDLTDGETGADRRDRDGGRDGGQLDGASETGAVDRAGLLAVEVALLRQWIADKDAVNAHLRRRLDIADERLNAAVEAHRKATDELSALRAAMDQRRAWGLLRRLAAAIKGV